MSHRIGIDLLVQTNRENSELFVNAQASRRLYRRLHPTEFAALKCMDGRIHLPSLTGTPLGIIQPYRNMGGNFSLGWPFFQQAIQSWRRYTASKGRDSVVFVTYHYSRGSTHRGCKGHNYDMDRALTSSLALKREFEAVYSTFTAPTSLFAILVGIETDFESLRLHGEGGEVVDLADVGSATEQDVAEMVAKLYPSINAIAPNVIQDLGPLVRGNILHTEEVRRSGRKPQETEHRESVLAVGNGFDWLHLPNMAIIVGPWQDNLSEPIATAATIIQENLESGKLASEDRVVLLTSGVYRVDGEERHLASLKSRYFREIASAVLQKRFPKLLPRLDVLMTTVDLNTRRMNVI